MSPPRLILHPRPNRGFLQGYPGIPPSETRPPAHLSGTIETQLGAKGLEVAWIRVEMSKTETLPGGEKWTELIGQGPIDVWTAAGGGDGRESWEHLRPTSFPFVIDIPEKLPPSLRLDKGSGISYQLIASMNVKVKKGIPLMRRPPVPIVVQATEAIQLDKHELHSTWPVYNVPEEFEEQKGDFRVKLYRNKQMFAPGDLVEARVIVYSSAISPAKLKGITMCVRQTVTFHTSKGADSGQPAPSQQRTDVLVTKTKSVRKKIYRGEFLMYDLAVALPKSRAIMSVDTAKHLEVSHALRIVADIAKEHVVLDHMPVQVSNFAANVSEATVARIGPVPALSLVDGADDSPHHLPAAARRAPTSPYASDTFGDAQGGAQSGAQSDVFGARVAAPTAQERRAAQEARPFDEYQEFAVDNMVPMPAFDSDHALVLGTPTPRGPLVFQRGADADNARPVSTPRDAPASPSQLQAGVRPGEIVSSSGCVTPRDVYGGEAYAPASRRATQMYADPDRTDSDPLATRASWSGVRAVNSDASGTALGGTSTATQWPAPVPMSSFQSAEAEKQRLFERARSEAQQFQAQYPHGASFPDARPGAANAAAGAGDGTAGAASSSAFGAPRFPNAEEEKSALYERARREVVSFHGHDPAAAELVDGRADGWGSAASGGLGPATGVATGAATGAATLPSADDEKAQMQRYYAAQDAVAHRPAVADRPAAQRLSIPKQPASDALASPAVDSAPSPVSPGTPYLTKSELRAVEEKEKLKSHYKQQETPTSDMQDDLRTRHVDGDASLPHAGVGPSFAAPTTSLEPTPAATGASGSASAARPPRPPKLPLA
ncbi:hypothetical protein MSPP1_004015 [Malassezia sp. CBS 17886]|nr:hypothetical protein MSPP1_004015 [Malassezia sp. CBS 17886]